MRKTYIAPQTEVIKIKTGFNILAGSPTIPLTEDDTTEQW